MKNAMGMLCLAGSTVLFWIAFHDIQNLLEDPTKPTITQVFKLVKDNTLGAS